MRTPCGQGRNPPPSPSHFGARIDRNRSTGPVGRVEIADYGLGAGVDLELLVNAPDVTAKGVNADRQSVRDFLVAIALGELRKNLLLPRAESLSRGRRRWTMKGLDHPARDAAGHWRTSRMHLGDGLEQFYWWRAFQDITRRSRGECG